MKKLLRGGVLWILRKALATDEGRQAIVDSLPEVLRSCPRRSVDPERATVPYHDLGSASTADGLPMTRPPIFVTGRFRSGTTLLWNIFRHLENCTAYYEPFNERRYFDPAVRGDRVDGTHLGVTEYWREYDGLEHLADLYDEDWIRRDLYLPAEAWRPRMKAYVDGIIEHAPGRPVLQFNRIDFRLPWVRRNYPDARIVHIYRHPRDQWCSTFLKKSAFPPQGAMSDYAPHDEFYLRMWARDLRFAFPFLDEREVSHPYQLSYFIWKLSYLFAQRYADYSLSLEDLLADPFVALSHLFASLELQANVDGLCRLVQPVSRSKWRNYADEQWFRQHESHCESVLQEFFQRSVASGERHVRFSNGTAMGVPIA